MAGHILWRPPLQTDVLASDRAIGLIERGIAAAPGSAALRVKLGGVHLDRHDYVAAAASFEVAIALDPLSSEPRVRLARCYNNLARHRNAIVVLCDIDAAGAAYERGCARDALGDGVAAEQEFRSELARDPSHFRSCKRLGALLRRQGRMPDLLDLCEGLAARGVDHAQLRLEYGRALALCSRIDEARRWLFDPDRVSVIGPLDDLPAAEREAFNRALAEDILGSAYVVSSFAPDEANRGSARVHALLAGRRPDLVRTLFSAIQGAVDRFTAAAPIDNAWTRSRPDAAFLHSWGLIQRGEAHEEWHCHPSGWLSGVYYLRVPADVSSATDGRGAIEFGPPPAVAEALPGVFPTWRHGPSEGELLLAPSHYHHRTIPSGLDEHRICVAFDVVPTA